MRSDYGQPFLALISSLDAIDFNLFFKEQDICAIPFATRWEQAFDGGQIHFDKLSPPVRVSLELLQYVYPTFGRLFYLYAYLG